MNDTLSRLLWALPLVLIFGVATMWLLRRWLAVLARAPARAEALALTQSLTLSDRSTAHLLTVDGRRLLVVESTSTISTVELDGARPMRARSGFAGFRPWP
jgi:flagellar biogenesis protein FliO